MCQKFEDGIMKTMTIWFVNFKETRAEYDLRKLELITILFSDFISRMTVEIIIIAIPNSF